MNSTGSGNKLGECSEKEGCFIFFYRWLRFHETGPGLLASNNCIYVLPLKISTLEKKRIFPLSGLVVIFSFTRYGSCNPHLIVSVR